MPGSNSDIRFSLIDSSQKCFKEDEIIPMSGLAPDKEFSFNYFSSSVSKMSSLRDQDLVSFKLLSSRVIKINFIMRTFQRLMSLTMIIRVQRILKFRILCRTRSLTHLIGKRRFMWRGGGVERNYLFTIPHPICIQIGVDSMEVGKEEVEDEEEGEEEIVGF